MCPYLISMCGIRGACHFSQNGWELSEVLTDATSYIALQEAALTKKIHVLATLYSNCCYTEQCSNLIDNMTNGQGQYIHDVMSSYMSISIEIHTLSFK